MKAAPLKRRTPGEPSALSLRHLSKSFGGALALDDVELEIMPGEIHGLLGHNGSGKSTLIKILSGYHTPEPGAEMLMRGEPVPLPVPAAAARRLGLAFVHQHLGLVPSMTVLENLLLGAIATETRWWLDWRRRTAAARTLFAQFDLRIDPAAHIADLPPVERALVAIVRAFEEIKAADSGGGVLVLDEPTPFLPKAGVDQLFDLIRRIVQDGAAVIFVSHDIDEIMQITDRATILRDGRVTGSLVTREATHDDFVERIVGRSLDLYHRNRIDPRAKDVCARISGASGAIVAGVSLDLHAGEVLGLTGLIGSGFDELPYLLFGARRASAGTLTLHGLTHQLTALAPPAAIAAGIALLPADRLGAGGIGSLPVLDNVSLPVLDEFFQNLLINWTAVFGRATQLGRSYEVRPNAPALNLASLSGGNQQKVLMAKWLQTAPKLLMLDEPTQGVDVGARQQLFKALGASAAAGTAIVVASTDYEQLAQICDRVLIFARGRIVAELAGDAISKETIGEQCLRSGAFNGESRSLEERVA